MIADRIINSIKNIPAFPAVALRIMDMVDEPGYSIAAVADLIRYDQAISANILRICNSAYFGLRQKVSTIDDAVLRLGQQNTLRAVHAAGISSFYRKGRCYGIEPNKLWEHSVGVALMSQILSRRLYSCDDARLYTMALLHDIGKVVMGEFLDESFPKIHGLVAGEGISFLEAEERVLGINHADLGGRIADHWNFPNDITEAIIFHHRPSMTEDVNSRTCLVYLSDYACIAMGIGLGDDGLAYTAVSDVIAKLNLNIKDLEECIILMLGDIDRASEIIGMV